MDLFVVQTIGFELLYGFVIVRIDRRDLVWINVATNPTAGWIARQITEASLDLPLTLKTSGGHDLMGSIPAQPAEEMRGQPWGALRPGHVTAASLCVPKT